MLQSMLSCSQDDALVHDHQWRVPSISKPCSDHVADKQQIGVQSEARIRQQGSENLDSGDGALCAPRPKYWGDEVPTRSLRNAALGHTSANVPIGHIATSRT